MKTYSGDTIKNAHRCLIYRGETLKCPQIKIYGGDNLESLRMKIHGGENLKSPRMKIHGGESEMPIDRKSMVVMISKAQGW